MNILYEEIGKEPYLLYGVHADLMEWVRSQSVVVQKGVTARDVTTENLIEYLGLRNFADRRIVSRRIVKQLWDSTPFLGPYPLLNILAKSEEEGKFYREYRDHSCHQLMVYLLGLFIYDNSCMKNAIQKEIAEKYDGEDAEEEFVRRWLAAALMHDIGYVLEGIGDPAVEGEEGEQWKAVCGELNATLKCPLAATACFNNEDKKLHLINAAEERQVSTKLGINSYEVELPAHIGVDRANDEDLLSRLQKEGVAAGLGLGQNGKSCLRLYYELAYKNRPLSERRSGFWDHGITSALILMRTWLSYAEKMKHMKLALDRNDAALTVIESAKDELGSVARLLQIEIEEVDAYRQVREVDGVLPSFETIRAAAAAIALHNINREIWSGHDADFVGLPIKHFCVRLPEKEHGRDGTALAFLLALADTLQDWGRLKFRPRVDQDRRLELIDEDLSIQPMGGPDSKKIGLFFRRDRSFGDKDTIRELKEKRSLYVGMVKRLSAFMDRADVLKVIDYNGDMTDKFVLVGFPNVSQGAGRRRETPEAGTAAFDLLREDFESIATLTDGFPRNGRDEIELRHCQNKPGAKPKPCDRSALSLILLAELCKCAEAARETRTVLACLSRVNQCYGATRDGRPQTEGGDPTGAELHAFGNHVRSLCNAVGLLLASVEACRILSPGEASALQRFLDRRDNGYAEEGFNTGLFVEGLNYVYSRWRNCKDGQECLRAWRTDPDLSSKFNDLEDPLLHFERHLTLVFNSRTTGTKSSLRTAFKADAFSLSRLETHLKTAHRTMPHRVFTHLHLSPQVPKVG